MTRLIATDLDGTLLREDKTVSQRTVRVLRQISARGVHVVLVTGRPVRWLARVCDQLDSEVMTICANGAVVYDPAADRVLRTRPLSPELLLEVCRRVRQEIPGVGFAVEVSDGRELRFEQMYAGWQDPRDQPIRELHSPAELCSAPAVKLLARSVARAGAADTATFASRIAGCLAGLAETTHSSDSGLVEISAAGITKATGLAWLCERLGVAASDVVAFGDMPNDVPMLAWAGRAVAVGNAHPAVREIADEITASNGDDGVARYLERMLPESPGSTGSPL